MPSFISASGPLVLLLAPLVDGEEGVRGIAILALLEMALAQPELRVGRLRVAGKGREPVAEALLGEAVVAGQDVAVGEVVFVARRAGERDVGRRRQAGRLRAAGKAGSAGVTIPAFGSVPRLCRPAIGSTGARPAPPASVERSIGPPAFGSAGCNGCESGSPSGAISGSSGAIEIEPRSAGGAPSPACAGALRAGAGR